MNPAFFERFHTVEYWGKFVMVMGLMALVDLCWTKYTIAVTNKHAMHSGLWSVGIMLCGAFVTVSYVEDRTLLFPAIIGAFAGTYYAIKHSKQGT